MAWITLDPVTRKRLHRFRQIRRGWWSFLILMAAILLSIFAPYLAESRALVVWYQGALHFPTFRYIEMSRFGQAPPPAWSTSEIEVEYLRLQREWEAERFMHGRDRAAAVAAGADAAALAAIDAKYPNRDHRVVMPTIPWDPYQNDFWANEILQEIQGALAAGQTGTAERLARRDRLHELADAIHDGSLAALLADPAKSATGTLLGLARSGAMPSIAHLGQAPPNAPDADRGHFLGTDAQGRDVASRLLYGFRISIFFALFLVLSGQLLGTVVGSLQGYLGGRFDIVSQRIIEVLIAIPFLYVVIVLAALFQPSFWMLLGITAIFQWIGITFFMRTEMYREKTREYCLAAKSYGASHLRIVFRHLLPNCLTPLVTFTPFAVVGAIFTLTGLDYLGYGLPAPTPSWGELIDQALQLENRSKLWLTLAPFGALTVTLVLVVFIGESVREAFDPKRYARYE
ncbi:MAG: ABC transporter permease subunit [Rubrivivax sp.]|jgi:microcin C transport system permease protein|nr:ABC transporter permease subunit [Betaproteobacteria bacterium]MBP6317488.1 ABC transporter permease subunit [Rubrivivax sp.]MBP6464039.1 ABC transporter permease subunit [Rubrivivax sp.]MBP9908117.1 ABC transporter permease subunit [Rubrivivax sp.]HRC37047.1 ABC transporter permease subunit [Rubrivivax sp.]